MSPTCIIHTTLKFFKYVYWRLFKLLAKPPETLSFWYRFEFRLIGLKNDSFFLKRKQVNLYVRQSNERAKSIMSNDVINTVHFYYAPFLRSRSQIANGLLRTHPARQFIFISPNDPQPCLRPTFYIDDE